MCSRAALWGMGEDRLSSNGAFSQFCVDFNVSLQQASAECGAQLLAHRRIDLRVAPGHAMARLARDLGEPTHERAADAEDVDVH